MCITLAQRLVICKRLKTFSVPGNGVVIHLPGLFEEAEKNLQKGKGNVSSINTCILVHACVYTVCMHMYTKYPHISIEFHINVGVIWQIGRAHV